MTSLSEEERPIDVFLVDLCGSSLVRSVSGIHAASFDTLVRTIRHPIHLHRLFTDIIEVVDAAQQSELLDALVFMVKHESSNAHACIEVGFHRSIVTFLEARGLWHGFPRPLLNRLLSLLLHISQYSIAVDDIRAMLQVFQCERMKHDEPDEDAVTAYLSTLELMARSVTGPSTYLELSGDHSGFSIASMDAIPFPSAGYTLSAWLRVESAPGLNSPLFSLCGDSGIGIEISFMDTTLVVKGLDSKKNEYNEVQVPNALVKHQWQWICVVHTHRQIRGSKLDVYINGDSRQSYRFNYPKDATVSKMQCLVARAKHDHSRCLKAQLGPVAFFSHPLQASIVESIKSFSDYDNVVLQYNASVASSHVTTSLALPSTLATLPATTPATTTGPDGLLFALDARNFDVKRNMLLDASGHNHHGENNHLSSPSTIRLRTTTSFKESIWQMGGPIVFFPLLLHPSTQSAALTSCQATTSRPLGISSVPKVMSLVAETLRHSLINKFICRRTQAIPMMSLLLGSLPPAYLTAELLSSIERLCSAVSSDRFISDEIHRYLLYNFRLWVPASLKIQNSIFDKLHVAIKKKFVSSSVVSIRYMLRLLSTQYQTSILPPTAGTGGGGGRSSHMRGRILETIRILLYDPESWAKAQSQRKYQLNSIIMGVSNSVNSMGVSFDAARTLIYSMLGKATFPQGNIDDTIKGTVVSEAEMDAGAIPEHVAETDIPDLLQILVDFSVTPATQTEFLSIFERLGGLRIWLPLISTANAQVRRMTLRLLRTYIVIKCDSYPNANPKPSLSAVDVRMILDSLHVAEFPLQMGSFNELVSLVLGIDYGDPTADPFALVSHDHAEMLADNILLTSSIRHPNMVVPMLELIQKCHLHVRWVGLECFKLLLSDDNVEGALNRRVFLACYATQGYAPYPVEVFFASFVTDAPQLPASDNSFAEAFSSVSTTGLRDVPILRLRELMANVDLADDARLGAAMSLLLLGDHQSLFDLLSNDSAKCDQYRRYKQLAKDNTLLSNRFKTGMRMLLSSIARSRTQEHVVATCMDVMAHMIVVDMKTNEAAYELVLHPFKLVPNQPHVVMTWLKVLVDRLGALVDSHMPPKGSLCWRNLDNICSIATSVVLHFDPWASVTTTACQRESLVDEDDGRTAAAVFWKAKDEYAKERELSDAILNVWHKCASSLSCDVDASFGRTAQPRLSLSSSQVPVATRSSPSTGAAAKRNSIKDQSQPPTIAPSSLRQFPGGAMRQILALILRSMYMAIKDQDMFLHSHGEYNEEDEDEEDEEDEDESPAPRRRSRVNSTVALDAVFAAKLAKLDYFVELLQLNQQNYVPAKEDASLVHWLALELRHLMEEAGRLSVHEPRWTDGARRCAEFVSRVLLQNTQNVVTSVDHVRALLDRQEFELTDTEVGRRDLFYHEYLETSQEIRHKKKSHVLAVVEYERECAKQAVDVVLASGIQVRPSTDPVWLQRVHAKDVDDWMKLERVLRWNIRHVWSVDSLSQATKWQLDSFTSSKWMRCRLLPDVDKVHPYKKLARTINNSLYDALVNDTLASTPAILVLPPSADDDLDDDNQHTLDVDDDRVHVVMGRSTDDDLDDLDDMVDMVEGDVMENVQLSLPRSSRDDTSMLGSVPTAASPMASSVEISGAVSSPPPLAEVEPVKRASMSSRFVTGLRLPMFSTKKVDKVESSGAKQPVDDVAPDHEGGVVPTDNAARVPSPADDKPPKKLITRGSFRTMAYIVLPEGRVVRGMFRLGSMSIVFEGEAIVDEQEDSRASSIVLLKRRIFGMRVIKSIYRRRFNLDILCGMEIYFVDGTSLLIGFETSHDVDTAFAIIRQRKPPCLVSTKRLLTGDRLVQSSHWHATAKWVRREISTFEYLMLLNVAAARSYNDITQYPIFPWVLSDYASAQLDLEDPATFRDFTKPIGAQSPHGVQAATQRYHSTTAEFPYHFGASYSSQAAVLTYLMRMAPFTQASNALPESSLQPLSSIAAMWERCTTSVGWELVPELYMTAEGLLSAEFGNVVLPPWANESVDTFIRLHRQALESDYVSMHLHSWIDLVFGTSQRGPDAVDSLNVFHPVCYPDGLNLNLLDLNTRKQFAERGTIPVQLFKARHPRRLTVDESLEARYPASHAVASLSSRSQVRRYDVSSRHDMALSSVRFSSATATGGGMGAMTKSVKAKVSDNTLVSSAPVEVHGSIVYSCDETGLVLAKRYQNSTPDATKGVPFTLQDVEQWWRLPAMCSIVDGMVYYEHMISCGYFDGSWRIHWSADGELLQRIAFHKQKILCMARSEDDVTGDVALAFGSEDCTISVWAISKFAASRSRRMFLSTAKKELPVGNLPWVLLVGHSRPVVTVAINVELDVVASTCTGHTLLLHSLRTSCPLHAMDLSVPTIQRTSLHLTISAQGSILCHAIHDANQLNSDTNWRASSTQSELLLVSLNGRVMSRVTLSSPDNRPMTLLQRGVTFTRCGEFVVTANATRDGGGIEVRPIGDLNSCVRRIETNRSSVLTCFGLSQDERCVVAGYEDGSLVMFALHYGISDQGRLLSDKRAREVEAAAFARATTSNVAQPEVTTLSVPPGLELDPIILTNLTNVFLKLKRPCVADDVEFEQLLRQFWGAVYPPMDILNEDIKYERVGASWSRLGFQRPDPTTDFRAGGILSLHCLVSFASKYPTEVKRMTSSQIPGSHEHTYPWGPVAINITCMMASRLWGADGQLHKDRENLWPVFASPDAFYVMFAEAFLLFDCAWYTMNAQYSSFSGVMEAITNDVMVVLKDNHGSLDEFQRSIRARAAALETSATPQPPSTTTTEPAVDSAVVTDNLITFSPPSSPLPSGPPPSDIFSLLQFSPPKPMPLVDPFAEIRDPFASPAPFPGTSPLDVMALPTETLPPQPPSYPASNDPFSPRNMHQGGPLDYTDDPFAGL
ncbi:hypothetical protein, variant 2 [Aphanomyces astaci]|uniref:BEACH domain-containing protein n=1 Tax=Aphanomyces astaci TaxID=112090 RepID=W4HAC3_APHAT|nr:hypothetical protein, variant 2 [Aphanomyces astaci]ETV88887.1 hypothetical protein, variant 2 [Aphanomyces astaci]|eukprot:XP_009821287.1 hypothetical protein, variant 2 [Aphanomyces astaci]